MTLLNIQCYIFHFLTLVAALLLSLTSIWTMIYKLFFGDAVDYHGIQYLKEKWFFSDSLIKLVLHKNTTIGEDDVIVAGQNFEECVTRVRQVLQRFKTYNLHINHRKSIFFESSMKYLGHIIDEPGLYTSTGKTNVIIKTPRLKKVHELGTISWIQQLWWEIYQFSFPRSYNLCTVYYKQINHLGGRKFILTHQERNYQWYCPKPYDPKLPLILATDASPWGISAILLHKLLDSSEKPIYLASWSSTKTECN